MVQHILSLVSYPVLSFLYRWIYDGELEDAYQEVSRVAQPGCAHSSLGRLLLLPQQGCCVRPRSAVCILHIFRAVSEQWSVVTCLNGGSTRGQPLVSKLPEWGLRVLSASPALLLPWPPLSSLASSPLSFLKIYFFI